MFLVSHVGQGNVAVLYSSFCFVFDKLFSISLLLHRNVIDVRKDDNHKVTTFVNVSQWRDLCVSYVIAIH